MRWLRHELGRAGAGPQRRILFAADVRLTTESDGLSRFWTSQEAPREAKG
jgi:hypothetical protein